MRRPVSILASGDQRALSSQHQSRFLMLVVQQHQRCCHCSGGAQSITDWPTISTELLHTLYERFSALENVYARAAPMVQCSIAHCSAGSTLAG